MNLKERAEKIEEMVCGVLNITSEEYLEMWYEAGCTYAENLFKNWALTGKAHHRAVNIYIRSNVFWYFWAKNWLKSCEGFLTKGLHSKEGFMIYVRNQPEPNKALHQEIVKNSKGLTKKAVQKFHEN